VRVVSVRPTTDVILRESGGTSIAEHFVSGILGRPVKPGDDVSVMK
jgi:hypothetical protein